MIAYAIRESKTTRPKNIAKVKSVTFRVFLIPKTQKHNA